MFGFRLVLSHTKGGMPAHSPSKNAKGIFVGVPLLYEQFPILPQKRYKKL
jgi:hypothetical protein